MPSASPGPEGRLGGPPGERDSYKRDLQPPDGSQVELFRFPNPPARQSSAGACGPGHLAFEVADVVEEPRGQGVTVEPIRVDEYTGRRFTYYADPDGLPLE